MVRASVGLGLGYGQGIKLAIGVFSFIRCLSIEIWLVHECTCTRINIWKYSLYPCSPPG